MQGVAVDGARRLGRRSRPNHPLHRLGEPREQHASRRSASSRWTAQAARPRARCARHHALHQRDSGRRRRVQEPRTSPSPSPSAVDQLRRYHNARKARGRGRRQRRQRAALLHEPVPRRDELRRGAGRDDRRGRSLLPRVEGHGAGARSKRCRPSWARTRFRARTSSSPGCFGPRICSTSSGTSRCTSRSRGKTVKIVCRYQQFRAVQYAVERLLHGKTRTRGRRARPTRRHRLAHAGLGQEPDDGLPRAEDALHPRAAPLQGRRRHRPQGPRTAALRRRRRSPARPSSGRGRSAR